LNVGYGLVVDNWANFPQHKSLQAASGNITNLTIHLLFKISLDRLN